MDPITGSLLALALTTGAVDAAETLQQRHHPGAYEENPILGRHPSDGKVIGYFALTGAVDVAAAKLLPPLWSRTYLGAESALELTVLRNNAKRGMGLNLRIKF